MVSISSWMLSLETFMGTGFLAGRLPVSQCIRMRRQGKQKVFSRSWFPPDSQVRVRLGGQSGCAGGRMKRC